MELPEAMRVLAGLTADQWGLVTAAQANATGVDNSTLHRLVAADLLDRVTRGVYAATSAVEDRLWRHKAAWLLLEPTVPAWKREPLGPAGGVLSHRSAAAALGLGDLVEERIELSVPHRRVTRNPDVRLRVRTVGAHELTDVDGLPVTSVERTVVDLLDDHVDGGHVADIAAQALRRNLVDRSRLERTLAEYVHRKGGRGSGSRRGVLRHLLAQATVPSGQDQVSALIERFVKKHYSSGLSDVLKEFLFSLNRYVEENAGRAVDGTRGGDAGPNS